jgi:uncharacterized protein
VTFVPTYFGDPGKELFGIYHEPLANVRGGVVLCHPGPQDYRLTYWSVRKLALLLAKAGFHVLRFDYFATGDSAGESDEGSLVQWTADVRTAAEELRDRTGLSRVSLVGMRLGAALAARASAGGLRVRDLVLWEPVTSGREYLAQLGAVQARMLTELHYPQFDRVEDDELLGYPLTATMRASLESLDLTAEGVGRPERLLVLGTRDEASSGALRDRATAAGVTTLCRVVEDQVLYSGTDRPGDTILAHPILVAIVEQLTQRTA